MNFIESLLDLTKEWETPRKFIEWAGIASISAVLKRKVFIQKRGGLIVYPNLYICIVGKSGIRKSAAPNIAQKLVKESEMTKLLVDRGSIQYIIEDLRNVKTFKSGKIITEASGFFCSEELNASLVNDPASQPILTRLYDSNYSSDHESGTKKDGRTVLTDFYLTMLTATNQEHLTDFLDKTSIAGGFLARTLVIKADRKENINPLISETEEEDEGSKPLDIKPLSDFLKGCDKLTGKMRMDNSYRHVLRKWYKDFQEKLEIKNNDKTGINERLHDHILKVSICLAVSDNYNMVLSDDTFDRSLELCTESASDTSRVAAGTGKGELSQKLRLLADDLLSATNHQLQRKAILAARWGDFDGNDLDRMIENLMEAGAVEVIRHANGPIYRMTAQWVQRFNNLIGSKSTAQIKEI